MPWRGNIVHGAGKVILRAAPAGTGIIAGGPMRAVFEALGVQDVVAKSTGTSNPHNMVKATFDALTGTQSPRMVAARRGKKVADVLGRRSTRDAAAGESADENVLAADAAANAAAEAQTSAAQE